MAVHQVKWTVGGTASWKSIRRHWLAVGLYLALSFFFLGACFISAGTYSAVVKAQHIIELTDAEHSAYVLENGSVLLTFSIVLDNPSRYPVTFSSVRWDVSIVNDTGPSVRYIILGGEYYGLSAGLSAAARSQTTYSYELILSGSTLSEVRGFVEYSNVHQGTSLTLETAPYVFEFEVLGWLGDFQHEYLRETYLNDLVTINLTYSSSEGEQ